MLMLFSFQPLPACNSCQLSMIFKVSTVQRRCLDGVTGSATDRRMLSAMPQGEEQPTSLLDLPEPLLLAVLQCLATADDQRSLFSAARAHSRLRLAAVAALSTITVQQANQQQVDGVLWYLGKHGQRVRSVDLTGGLSEPILQRLPLSLQLHSLQLRWLQVQLLPAGTGCRQPRYRGVLGNPGVSALKQLRLEGCRLLDDASIRDKLVPALAQRAPGLEHLIIVETAAGPKSRIHVPMGVLQHGLQQLTRLELEGVRLLGSSPASSFQQPSQGWSRLAELRLVAMDRRKQPLLTASILSGAANLTRLEVQGFDLQPAALAGKSQLQHLQLSILESTEDEAWTAQLQYLQQLTGLRQLLAYAPRAEDGLLLQMTRLRQLTQLQYYGPLNRDLDGLCFDAQAASDEPVWRQVLQRHLDHSDPAVAQQAAAALAASD